MTKTSTSQVEVWSGSSFQEDEDEAMINDRPVVSGFLTMEKIFDSDTHSFLYGLPILRLQSHAPQWCGDHVSLGLERPFLNLGRRVLTFWRWLEANLNPFVR